MCLFKLDVPRDICEQKKVLYAWDVQYGIIIFYYWRLYYPTSLWPEHYKRVECIFNSALQ